MTASTTTPIAASESTAEHGQVLLEAIDKRFGPTHAVADVSLALSSREVTAVMGGNGAGKSTLMKILAGEVQPDSGRIELDGVPVNLTRHSPRTAHEAGIRFVHQELSLADSLTVAENFYVEHRAAGGGSLRWQRNAARTAEAAIVEHFGPDTGIRATDRISALSVAQRQIVEIARAASAPGVRVLILDEPTSAMGREYLPHMQRLVRQLRDRGVVVLVITHKMYELPMLADRVVVLREGALVADVSIDDAHESALIGWMTGAASGETSAHESRASTGEVVVRAEGLDTAVLRGVDLVVRKGEVVGLAGLQGGGQPEVLKAVLEGRGSGLVVDGSVAYVTGDRKDEGILPLWSSRMNLAISALVRTAPLRPFRAKEVDTIAQPWLDRLRLPAEAGEKRITSLSGGMQQKVLIARALAADADILLLNDPTRGVDVHTKREIYGLIHEAADRGMAVLWCSSEDLEAAQCDRVYVLADGAVVAETTGARSGQDLVAASFAEVGDRAVATDRRSRAGASLAAVVRAPWFLAALGLLVAFGIIVGQQPLIASYTGLELVLSLAPVLAVAGLGQMFVIALGDIDLGIGAYLGYVGVVAATALHDAPALGLLLLVGGVVAYPLIGLLVAVRNVPPIVATLGMSFVWLGLALTVQPTVGGTVPAWLTDLYNAATPLVPLPLLLLVIAALVGWVIVRRSRLGVLVRGIGSNSTALAHAGWNVLLVRAAAYTLAGVFGLVAGLMFAAVATSGDANGTAGYTLISIAAAVIGGCSFSGGRISPVGVVVAATLLTLLAILLSALSVPPVFTAAAQGLLLLVVMGLRRVPLLRPEVH